MDFVEAVEGKLDMEAAAAAGPVLPLPNTRTLVVADTSALLGQNEVWQVSDAAAVVGWRAGCQ